MTPRELHLIQGVQFCGLQAGCLAPDGAGGLIDSDGDALFRSELPD